MRPHPSMTQTQKRELERGGMHPTLARNLLEEVAQAPARRLCHTSTEARTMEE